MHFQCPKLTPLQSRFVASFATLVLLGLIYWTLSNPHFAYAAELEIDESGHSRGGEDHNWHRIEEQTLAEDGVENLQRTPRIVSRKRVTDAKAISANNAPNMLNIEPGNTSLWMYSRQLLETAHVDTGPGLPTDPTKRDFEPEHAELRKRQDSGDQAIYVSINTCLQPTWNSTDVQTVAPPQLTLYVATFQDHEDVGPNGSDQYIQVLSEGFANVSVPSPGGGSWYIAVTAPDLPGGFAGVWNYELAVSNQGFYHRSDPLDPFLLLVDTDDDSALLVTRNLTQEDATSDVWQQWMDLRTPYTMFAANVNHTITMGIQSSYCGWKNAAQIAARQDDSAGVNSHVEMGMITRGLENKPKEQFYVTNLNSSSNYIGVLAEPGNSTNSGSGVVGGGGKVWQPVTWQTKTDGNCALMFNLSFCDEVAYAVPSNPNRYNTTGLRIEFDNYTSYYYQQFGYSLQQIPCNTTSDAQYSTVKTCTDCAAAYKQWLCAVSIPRCEDFTNPATYLQVRNVGQQYYNNNSMLPDDFLQQPYVPMHKAPTLPGSPAYNQTYLSALATNSSRNPTIIDQKVQPGPYKEVLPCEDLCFSLMQSCPAALGFVCPFSGRGLEAGYGKRSTNGTVTCSYLGAVYDINAAPDLFAPVFMAFMVAALVVLAGSEGEREGAGVEVERLDFGMWWIAFGSVALRGLGMGGAFACSGLHVESSPEIALILLSNLENRIHQVRPQSHNRQVHRTSSQQLQHYQEHATGIHRCWIPSCLSALSPREGEKYTTAYLHLRKQQHFNGRGRAGENALRLAYPEDGSLYAASAEEARRGLFTKGQYDDFCEQAEDLHRMEAEHLITCNRKLNGELEVNAEVWEDGQGDGRKVHGVIQPRER